MSRLFVMAEKPSYKALMEQAAEAEKNGDNDSAVELYQQAMKQSPSSEAPYQRLMILYRKAKEYKKELAVINNGIRSFKQQFQHKHKQSPLISTKAARVSKTLAKSLGLTDKKGNSIHTPEPILKWEKRKQLLLKKMKK